MSVKNDVINLQINVNSNEAQNELNNLRRKADTIKESMVGLKKSTQEYKDKAAELKQVNTQMDELKRTIGLTALSQKELERELSKLQRLKSHAVPFSDEYKEWARQIAAVENRLYEVKNNVTGFSKIFSKVKDEIKQFGALAVGYLGFQFVSEQFSNIIRGAGKMSDQLADLRRVSGLTGAEVQNLNKSLSQLNTRTATSALREIAIIAGKLGVAKEDILGFTEATDKLVVALGDELGNADEITTQLGKILNVFDGKVNGENITRLGNAFVELANSGVASGGFIADFTQRVSGIAKASNLSLGATVGLAAGLEELGQRSESSGTAVQKLLTSIANDLPKAAKIAGAKSAEEFAKIFAKSPEEALLKYAEGLTKNKSSFAEVAASFKDAGEEGARIVGVLQAIGQQSEFMRSKIELGKKSIQEAGSINEAFALKNETIGASLDKLGKEFASWVASSGVTKFVTGLINVLGGLIEKLRSVPQWLKDNRYWVLLLTTGILLMNAAYIKSAFAIAANTNARLLNTIAQKAGYAMAMLDNAITVTATAIKNTYSATLALLTGRITLATAAQRIWTAALSIGLGPVGTLVVALGALTGLVAALASGFKESSSYMSAYAESTREANAEIAKQKSQIETLTSIAGDHNISLETRKAKLQELIAISPEYLQRLTLENISTDEGRAILDRYNTALEKNANLKAANVLKDKEFENNTRLKALKQELEVAQKLGLGYGELSEEAQEAFSKITTSVGRTAFSSDLFNRSISSSDFKTALADIDEDLKKSQEKLHAYTENVKERTNEVSDARRNFLLKEMRAYRDDMNNFRSQMEEFEKLGLKLQKTQNSEERQKLEAQIQQLKSGADSYKKAKKGFDEANAKFQQEFMGGSKKTVTPDVALPTTGTTNPKNNSGDNEYKKLLEDRRKFEQELDKLKNDAAGKTQDERERELDRVEQQFRELTERAKKYWVSTTADGKEALSKIAEIRNLQLDALLKKFFKEDSANEYDEAIKASDKFFEKLRQEEGLRYAGGEIDKLEYEKNLTNIEEREMGNRVQIAQDYAETVKKAEDDVTKFTEQQSARRIKNAISESEKKKAATVAEQLAGLRLNVITAPRGSLKELEAKKALLKKQFELDTEYLDKKSNVYKEKEEQLTKDLEELQLENFRARVDRILEIANAVGEAMQSINTLLANREARELQRDKAVNNKKREQYSTQLSQKLISQEVYNRKIAALDKEEERKEKELALKKAKREKAVAIFTAIINTAAAIAKALPDIALAIIAGVMGGLQVAAIASAPLPEMGTGGLLTNGPKHRDRSRGLHVVNPNTGKTELLIERGEAVIAARAMDSRRKMTVTGTPKEIASAINSTHGGRSFASGASVKWHNSSVPQFKPHYSPLMANGGIVGAQSTKQDGGAGNDFSEAFVAVSNQLEALRGDMAAWQTNLKAHVVLKDIESKTELMNKARSAGAIVKGG